MNPVAGIGFKVIGGGAVAALLSLGVADRLAQAAGTGPSSSAAIASRSDRHVLMAAVLESEADVLGIKPEQLRYDLRHGQTVSDLARDRGLTKEQFADRLIAGLRPRLEQLVDHKVITQAQADRIIDRISKGHIPFWEGSQRRK